jgi:group II intron reverse transcriptase/maturase
MAISHALQLHASGFKVVLDADIKGFFDNLPHQVILQAIRDQVADGKVLDLLERFLRCGVLEDGRLLATTKGTPQGGVISPLLANIVLNRLDWHLDQLGLRFVRYADDFVVLCQNRSQAEEARTQVETLLAQLGLSLSAQKTAITSYGKGYTFLGFILSSRSRRIRPKSLEKFKDKVRAITVRKHNLDLEMVDHLNALIRGVAQYFCASFATNREQFHKLDSWIRMRLRAMKFKRKNTLDNYKLRIRTFQRAYRLRDLESFYAATHASVHQSLSRGSSSRSRPATETVTPVNLWN